MWYDGWMFWILIAILIFSLCTAKTSSGKFELSSVGTFLFAILFTVIGTTVASIVLWLLLRLFLETHTAWKVASFIIYALFALWFDVVVYFDSRDNVVNGMCDRKKALNIVGSFISIPLVFFLAWLYVPNIIGFFLFDN